MGQPIVLQLQEYASSNEHSITDLLRKALIVATKLNLEEFRSWIWLELNGYEPSDKVPKYRNIIGDVRVQNPYRGLIPFYLPPEVAVIARKMQIRDSCDKIAHMISASEDGFITTTFAPELERRLMDMQEWPQLRPVRVLSASNFFGIIQVIKTRILDWALLLESQGIIGDGISFSEKEQMIAMSNKSIQIENFQGIIGDVHGGQISQTNTMSITASNFSSLATFLESKGVSKTDIIELEHAVNTDPAPTNAQNYGPKVSNWMGKMMSKAANGGWDVSLAIVGTLLATAIGKFYGL